VSAYQLRPATSDDVHVLSRAVVDGVAVYRSFAPPGWRAPSLAHEAERLRALLGEDDVWCLVAECDGALAGQVTVLPAARAPHPVAGTALAHLRNLFVERDFWGTGLARTLNAAAVEAARERGYEALRLFTPARQERARRFYEREGWAQRGEAFHDPGPDLELVEYRYALRSARPAASS
jgi:GNAT superfamily N-acetyltransferase